MTPTHELKAIFAPSVLTLAIIFCRASAWGADAPASADVHVESFAQAVQPFVQKHCVACHGAETQEGEDAL